MLLSPLVDEYRRWIGLKRRDMADLNEERRDTADELLRRAGHAADRMARGIAALVVDEDALDAFRVANRAVARALCQRLPDEFANEGPRWRTFQLAFILLNLPGVVDPHDPERETSPPVAARPRPTLDSPPSRSCCEGYDSQGRATTVPTGPVSR